MRNLITQWHPAIRDSSLSISFLDIIPILILYSFRLYSKTPIKHYQFQILWKKQ